MSFSLLTNIASMNAQVNVDRTQNTFDASVARLSSGLRITTPADDSAGLAISSRLTAEILSLQAAQRNANDAISALQTADGGYGIINSLLTRMRELSVEAANVGTISDTDRGLLNDEFQNLALEIDRISVVTEYNGVSLIGTNGLNASFQVGAYNTSHDQINVTLSGATGSSLNVANGTTSVSSSSNALAALTAVDTAITTLAGYRAQLGAAESRVNAAVSNLQSQIINISAGNSRIKDTDIASETAAFTSNQILLQAGVSLLSQANQEPTAALTLIRG